MAVKRATKRTILNAVSSSVRSLANITIQRDTLIAKAVEAGATQTEVAKAAGMSQAHVSRVLAAYRKDVAERKAARSPRARSEGGTV